MTSARTEPAADFAAATAVEAAGEGRWRARVDEGWFAVRGPNGGYLAAIVVRAMQAAVADPARHARSLTLHYTRPPAAGAVELAVAVERRGRRLTSATCRMEQEGRLCVLATGAFSVDFGTDPSWSVPAPDVPCAAEVPALPRERALVPIARRFEVRPALGPVPFSSAGEARSGGWIAPRDGRPPLDAAALAMLADAWLPSPFTRLPAPVAAPTIDLTIHFRAPDVAAEWPVLVDFRSRFAHGGFFEEDGEIYSQDGRLLAQSRQLGLLT